MQLVQHECNVSRSGRLWRRLRGRWRMENQMPSQHGQKSRLADGGVLHHRMWHSVCSCCRRRGARWQMLCQLRHDRTVIYGQRRVVDELPGKRPTTDAQTTDAQTADSETTDAQSADACARHRRRRRQWRLPRTPESPDKVNRNSDNCWHCFGRCYHCYFDRHLLDFSQETSQSRAWCLKQSTFLFIAVVVKAIWKKFQIYSQRMIFLFSCVLRLSLSSFRGFLWPA